MKAARMIFSTFLLSFALLLAACSPTPSTAPQQAPAPDASSPASQTPPVAAPSAENKEIILATTTSTQDSGLLDAILPEFEKQTGIAVKVIAVGTGQAIKLGEEGNADVLLVHSRKAEDEFVNKGFGINAHDVMYNQFYIVGPADDPAGIKGVQSAKEAMGKIAAKQAPFVSRGDDSGTDKKEKSIWSEAQIKPEGSWYISSGQGMGETLQMADEKRAYTLTDEATFLSRKLNLEVLVQGDQSLLNPYGIIQVTSSAKPEEGMQLIQFFTGEIGQKLIGEFGKDTYGKGLFAPDARKR